MLRESCLTVRQIAMRCGIRNPSSFARAYRRHFDETPSRFRRRIGWSGADSPGAAGSDAIPPSME